MKIQLKLLLVFLSLIICSCTTVTNTATKQYDLLKDVDPLTLNLVALPTHLLNPFQENEYFFQVSPGHPDLLEFPEISNTTTAGFYTLFFTFTEIEPADDASNLSFTLNIYCGTAGDADKLIINPITHSNTFSQKVDLTVVSAGGASMYMRRDFFNTIIFPKGSCSSTILITINLTGLDDNHIFLIKRLALISHTCHPHCSQCTDTSPMQCISCLSGFTKVDTDCTCDRHAPYSGLISQYPSNLCKVLLQTPSLPCTEWVSTSDTKLSFDYCVSCGGQSHVAQYMKMPFTYSALDTPYTDQEICKCPYGNYAVTSLFQKECKTLNEGDCIDKRLSTEVDIEAASSYLANISANLAVTIGKRAETVLGLLDYKEIITMTFQVINNMTDPKLLSYRIYYTLTNDNIVQINVPQDGAQHTIKINYLNLSNIKDCTYQSISPGKVWKCKIQVVAYNPCNNLKYMHAYIPIEIGDGVVKTSAAIGIPIEFRFPCIKNKQCSINKTYVPSINLLSDSRLRSVKESSDFVIGDSIWVQSSLTPTHTHDLQYAFLDVYNSVGKFVGSIDVLPKYIPGSSENIYGFPVEIPRDILESEDLSSGQMSLTMTFNLGTRHSRMLDDSNIFSITTPVSISINIVQNNGSPAATIALIFICTLIGAAIVRVIVYFLLKKKKNKEKKLELHQEKVCITETGNPNFSTGEVQRIKAEDQRI